VVVATWLGLLAFGTWRAQQTADRQVRELEAKISDVQRENNKLESVRGQYQNPAYLEKQARAKLNYKAPDETVVFVYPDDKKPGSSDSGVSLPNWRKWVAWLKEFIKF